MSCICYALAPATGSNQSAARAGACGEGPDRGTGPSCLWKHERALTGDGILEPDRSSVQIILIRTLDFHRGDFADPQRPSARDIDRTVNLGRVALAAALGYAWAGCIDDHLLATADLA